MNQTKKKEAAGHAAPQASETIPKASRQEEEAFLEETLSVIHDNLVKYGGQVQEMRKEIDDMLDHFHDDNPELINLLENSMTLYDQMKRALERNERAQNKPYFGRIVFYDEALEKEESLYIGKGGISKDATHQTVIDWRAPVANAYYENGLGKCSYMAPGDKQMNIDLRLKRTYEIEKGKLLEYFDSEVVANDDLLTKYLAKNKQAVLGEIVATIQKEQNEIIRKSPYHNMIVQGVAGSGKTTVAMHRISFILYNYQERFKPDDFYIVGSNRILLNYITGVLPDLDVYGVRQMTMEQLFIRLLYEDWDERKFAVKKSDRNGSRGSIKGSLRWFEDLKAYCDELEWSSILRESIYLNPKQFVEGLKDGKNGVYDETVGKEVNPYDLVCLVDGAAVERYIRQNPKISMQNKINMLNERLIGKVKDEFLGKGVKYTAAEKKAILKAYKGRYGGKVWKGSIYELYHSFLRRQSGRGMDVEIPGNEFDVYDLAALAYIYKRIKETEVISEAHHIVIDEAQDFGMMAYSVLHFCIEACTYTVMGDVSQNIHFGFGLNDWEELRGLLLKDEMDSFGILKKSYRNTVEISDFATKILHHGNFFSYPVEPIIRHGDPVNVQRCAEEGLMKTAAEVCKGWQKKGFETIAVVCRNQYGADRAAEELGRYVEVMESDLEKAVFGSGIMVLPVEYTKGLEFDTVLILDPTREDYPSDDGHAKLLYVAATRALHELCVLHCGELTGLIADPVPEKSSVQAEKAKRRKNEDKGQISGTDRVKKKAESAIAERQNAFGQRKTRDTSIQNSCSQSTQMETSKNDSPSQLETVGKQLNSRSSAGLSISAARPRPVITAPSAPKKTVPSTLTSLYSNASPVVKKVQPAEPQKQTVQSAFAFGALPATEKLRPAGHSKIDLSIRWVTRKPDGLYLQSRYGTLRLSPVGSAILRVTFARNGEPSGAVCPGIAVDRTDKFWMYRDSASSVDLTTDELALRLDKVSGAIRYFALDEESGSRKILLSERARECRQLENVSGGGWRTWIYLDFARDEHLYAIGPGGETVSLRGTARYVSGDGELPFLLSDKGYGILMAASSPVISCDLAAYGSYLHGEREKQLDYYFIAGKRRDTILNARSYLLGKL